MHVPRIGAGPRRAGAGLTGVVVILEGRTALSRPDRTGQEWSVLPGHDNYGTGFHRQLVELPITSPWSHGTY